jgi:predicted enzyme related to lactoylglutathione lyase
MPGFHGNICWSELHTRDPEQARTFYGRMFGWSFEQVPIGDTGRIYSIAKHNGESVAGIMDMRDHAHLNNVPAQWLTFVAVDDVRASVKAVVDAGGIVRRDCFTVPGTGTIAVVCDPSGAVLALMTPLPRR